MLIYKGSITFLSCSLETAFATYQWRLHNNVHIRKKNMRYVVLEVDPQQLMYLFGYIEKYEEAYWFRIQEPDYINPGSIFDDEKIGSKAVCGLLRQGYANNPDWRRDRDGKEWVRLHMDATTRFYIRNQGKEGGSLGQLVVCQARLYEPCQICSYLDQTNILDVLHIQEAARLLAEREKALQLLCGPPHARIDEPSFGTVEEHELPQFRAVLQGLQEFIKTGQKQSGDDWSHFDCGYNPVPRSLTGWERRERINVRVAIAKQLLKT